MSEAVQLALIGVISSLVTGGIVVAVAAWVQMRKSRVETRLRVEESAEAELSRVRQEYRDEINHLRVEVKGLRERLEAREREIDTLQDAARETKADLRACLERAESFQRQLSEIRARQDHAS